MSHLTATRLPSPRAQTLYRQFRKAGETAVNAWRAQRIIRRWEALANVDAVRLRAEFDEITTSEDGEESFGVIGEYRVDFNRMTDGHWPLGTVHEERRAYQHGDSVWGCSGYSDVLSPTENPYVIDIMAETITAFATAWKAHVARERDLRAGRCPECHGSGQAA